MLTLLHGDHHENSRNELRRLVAAAQGREIRNLDGRGVTPEMLTQALESSSLFGGDTLVVIENLFSRLGKQLKLSREYARILADSSTRTDVILWEGKELTPAVVKSLGKAAVRPFKMPAVIFKFLDSFMPRNQRPSLLLLRSVLENEPAEIVYAMLIRRIRLLIQLADHVTPPGLAPWQAARLTRQAGSFTMEKLLDAHARLVSMDIAIKTGASPFSLAQLLEQLIISV